MQWSFISLEMICIQLAIQLYAVELFFFFLNKSLCNEFKIIIFCSKLCFSHNSIKGNQRWNQMTLAVLFLIKLFGNILVKLSKWSFLLGCISTNLSEGFIHCCFHSTKWEIAKKMAFDSGIPLCFWFNLVSVQEIMLMLIHLCCFWTWIAQTDELHFLWKNASFKFSNHISFDAR